MSLRRKFILYLLGIHLLFAGVVAFSLWEHRAWLLALEVFFLLSFLLAVRLLNALFKPIDLVLTGAEFIKERDFTSKFLEVGQLEIDQLIVVYNRMIDQLREERTRLQEKHYFLERVLQASPSGIITCDFDEKISYVNPAAEKILQAPAEALLGKTLAGLDTRFGESLNLMRAGESQIIHLQGRRRVKCQKSQFLDQGFARTFILLEELTEELRRSEKAAYEKLIRMMSHEINNSTGAVQSLLHSCLNYQSQLREDDRKDFANALQVAILRIDHLNTFMRGFANVIKLPPPRKQPCNLAGLLHDIELLLKAECERRNIVWKQEIPAPLPAVALDKSQMEQVFINIFKNAMEAIGENGVITVRSGEKNGRVLVVIEDSGSGFTPEVRQHLFTPFFSTKAQGQGLGLTMIQEILTQHQFEFSLESAPTQFVIYFN
ncbi:PAS domain-containing protein [candidate division KSB1 bacterium]|nr:PAS domain-containing protein [candidate division KSB1 bacterium]